MAQLIARLNRPSSAKFQAVMKSYSIADASLRPLPIQPRRSAPAVSHQKRRPEPSNQTLVIPSNRDPQNGDRLHGGQPSVSRDVGSAPDPHASSRAWGSATEYRADLLVGPVTIMFAVISAAMVPTWHPIRDPDHPALGDGDSHNARSRMTTVPTPIPARRRTGRSR